MSNLTIGPSLVQVVQLRLQQRQRQLATLLELPDDEMDGRLDEFVSVNPALVRVRPGGPRQVASWAARRPDRDERRPEVPAAGADAVKALWDQLRLERLEASEGRVALLILGNLDSHGFLAVSLAEVAETAGVSVDVARQAQARVMTCLDPVGCGASGPRHYLRFMVGLLWPEDPYFPALVCDHLRGLRGRRYEAIGRVMDLDPEDVEEYHRMLVAHVPPWPLQGVGSGDPEFVRPTLDVVRDEARGTLVVRSLEPQTPKVQVDPRFEERLRALGPGEERTEALRHLREARELVRRLEERRDLTHRIATEAVRCQVAFFEEGPAALRNLTQEEVALAIGRHQSVVCRAVAGRYLRWGPETVSLRSLFSNRGSAHLTPTARLCAAIRAVVDAEDLESPLSDKEISERLEARGITGCKRRTVRKYRERLGIPSSRDRGLQ